MQQKSKYEDFGIRWQPKQAILLLYGQLDSRHACGYFKKGFQRDKNLQLHRRGHNLPWKLRQRTNKDIIKKKVYICPEKTCVHHEPSRALGDLMGIKKHFSRKHGEKKWKCEKCSKKYAVQSDWKLTPRLVAPESISVIVALYFPGICVNKLN